MLATKLSSREALQEVRGKAKELLSAQQRRIYVCAGTACVAGGALDIYAEFKRLLKAADIPCLVKLEEDIEESASCGVALKKSGCPGFCQKGPLVRIDPEGWLYTKVRPEDCAEIVERSIKGGEVLERLLYHEDGKAYDKAEEIPFFQKQTRLVLEHCGRVAADSIEEYLAVGGYESLEKALFDMTPEEITREISDSNLRGRGGGGFPTGRKWTQVRGYESDVKYIVCNGDEGDPGAFMDEGIMEGDPHRMLEGMMIASVACGASQGYIYVRAEYPLAVERLNLAIRDARKYGLLGKNILGSGHDFDIRINRGAGAFVCGEGSALTASIEGKRGMPRVKPPRTVEQGLFGKPTVLNNVETFANVPLIIEKGAQWYRSIGPENSPGTKAFALAGNISNTGLIEVPMGTKLREVIYDIGGGIREGHNFKAVQIGGPSGACLTEKDMEMPLDFDSLKKIGAMMGSGGLVVMDDKTCMVEVARFFMNFTKNESCGKCIPCREGTKRMLEILTRMTNGEGRPEDIDLLLELSDTISHTALCGLGKSAPNPVVSTIKNFREEYEAHTQPGDKHCPAGACAKLKHYHIDPEKCRGCSKCAHNCPVNAISGKVKSPFTIDQEKCIKCGTCFNVCPFHAIEEG